MTNLWVPIAVFLFVCFVLELIILFLDKGRIRRYSGRFVRSLRTEGLVNTLRLSVRKIRAIVSRRFKRNVAQKTDEIPSFAGTDAEEKNEDVEEKATDDGLLRIAIEFEGGIGDYLINANWYWYFYNKYVGNTIAVDIYAKSKSIFSVFSEEIPHTAVYPGLRPDWGQYDAVFAVARVPWLLSCNEARISGLSPNLHEYVLLCRQYREENSLICDNKPFLDGFQGLQSISLGIKRMQQADIYGKMGIDEEYRFPVKIQEDEDAYLDSLGLKGVPFILVHRGWDDSNGTSDFHVKAWSLKSCGDILKRIKARFPAYKLLLLGLSERQSLAPDGCDLNLVGKTNLEQAKVLLKHASCLVDNEGGMVHLRHALHGGASVVMFGPTAVQLFGYSENVNLTSGVCKQWCEWLFKSWTYKCAVTGECNHPCMEAITTDDVLAGMSEILEGGLASA